MHQQLLFTSSGAVSLTSGAQMLGQRNPFYAFIAVLCIFSVQTLNIPIWAAENGEVLYNQGQAPYDSRNPGRGRDEALLDLKIEVLTQAIENLVEEEALAKNKDQVQNYILRNPDRYLRGVQIVSQEIENGKIRLAGQVTVRIDVLSRGLRELGLKVTAPVAFDGQMQTDSPAAEDGQDPEQMQAAGNGTEEISASIEASDHGQEEAGVRVVQQPNLVTEGQLQKIVTVLWFVAEKWEQASPWHIPGTNELGSTVQALFAGSVRQEAQALRWTLVLPDSGLEILEQELDVNKNFPVDQAVKLAQDKNVRALVIGTATQQRRTDGKVVLVADLVLLDGTSGEQAGEVHREITLADLANVSDYGEEIIKLAAWVTPDLDQLARADLAGTSGAVTEKRQGKPLGAQTHGWVLMISGISSLAQWQELEQSLRGHFKDMEIAGLEYGAGNARVQLDKVGEDLPGVLKQSQLSTCRVEVKEEDLAGKTIRLTFVTQDSAQR
jgi:hypothetical protein